MGFKDLNLQENKFKSNIYYLELFKKRIEYIIKKY